MSFPLRPRRLRIRGERPAGWPDSTRVALCEGIAKPGKANAHWRLVGWIEREALAPLAAVERAEQALREARAEFMRRCHPVPDPEAIEEARKARTAAFLALARARDAERKWLCSLADPALGVAFVPGDCADVEFVP